MSATTELASTHAITTPYSGSLRDCIRRKILGAAPAPDLPSRKRLSSGTAVASGWNLCRVTDLPSTSRWDRSSEQVARDSAAIHSGGQCGGLRDNRSPAVGGWPESPRRVLRQARKPCNGLRHQGPSRRPYGKC